MSTPLLPLPLKEMDTIVKFLHHYHSQDQRVATLLYLRLGQQLGVVFSQMHFNQIPKFSSSELSILHCTESGKHGDENLGVFSEVYPNTIIFLN